MSGPGKGEHGSAVVEEGTIPSAATNNGHKSEDNAAQDSAKKDDPAWQLRKYLLLLAILVATVTYVAGMDPPGGVWLETKDGHRTGNPILPSTRRLRYTLFYYFNATAFALSLVVIILLLFLEDGNAMKEKVPAVRAVMVLDVLCLMVAYVAGSCRGRLTTIYASVLCAVVVLLIVLLNSFTRKSGNGKHVGTEATRNSSQAGEGGSQQENGGSQPGGTKKLRESGMLMKKERSKVLMLLAMFVTTITYTAALSPPGGFWEESPEDGASHRAGDPILLERHRKRFFAFLICNTTSFAASLVSITLLMSRRLWENVESQVGLYAGNAAALLGLMGAYAAGSGRETETTKYVLCLVLLVLGYISILAVIEILVLYKPCAWFGSRDQSPSKEWSCGWLKSCKQLPCHDEEGSGAGGEEATGKKEADEKEASEDPVDKARSLILLLATLAATVTYQAGLNPPGGVWRDNADGHVGGNLILLATHARRYKVFFYCNSAAFVTSIVVVIMVQSTSRVSSRALQAAVILDLFGLMGAYASGSCRDVRTSIYVFALAAVIFVAVVIYVVVEAVRRNRKPSPAPARAETGSRDSSSTATTTTGQPPPTSPKVRLPGCLTFSNCCSARGSTATPTEDETKENEKKRKLLLLLAILAVSITYQAGLTPPGKFWLEHGDAAHHVGDPVLADNYPRRYKAFFYCNATSFMVSVAVVVVLVGRKLPDADRKYWVLLYTSMAAGLIGLMGAYAAGTTRTVKTSIYVFALVGAVLFFAVLHSQLGPCISGIINAIGRNLRMVIRKLLPCLPTEGTGPPVKSEEYVHIKNMYKYRKDYRMNKYLLLLGILAASVTYQAGLDPPGGVWPSDGDGHEAGDPVLDDGGSKLRYHVFFYSNSMCFVTSVVVIVLLLQGTVLGRGGLWPMRAMHTAVVLDLLGLLVAYTTGGTRDWGTFGYVLAMAVTVLAYVAIYMALPDGNNQNTRQKKSVVNGSTEEEIPSPTPSVPQGGSGQPNAHLHAHSGVVPRSSFDSPPIP